MGVILPEKMAVKVYRSDDKEAPLLDKSANCVANIFKACLVTGYGDKQGAGWSLPFEDMDNDIKVFCPPVSAEQRFYLRLSQDTGKQVTAQVYTSMSDINTGNLVLECATAFKYATGKTSGRWLLAVSARSVWFFSEHMYVSQTSRQDECGSYFFVGDTCKNTIGDRALALLHTGGNTTDTSNHLGILEQNGTFYGAGHTIKPLLYDVKKQATITPYYNSLFNSMSNLSQNLAISPILLQGQGDINQLPGAFMQSVTQKYKNLQVVNLGVDSGALACINFATGANVNYSYAVLIRTDYWDY